MVASEVWDAENKPIEFVCMRSARRAMNIVAEMENALVRIWLSLPKFSSAVSNPCLSVCCYLKLPISVSLCSTCVWLLSTISSISSPLQTDCNGSMTFSTPFQLPCTELHVASWGNKSVCWLMYESKILYSNGFLTCVQLLLWFILSFITVCFSFSVCMCYRSTRRREET